MSRDSSVGRAGDCSGTNPDISRSAVQIRLAGLFKNLIALYSEMLPLSLLAEY